MTNRRNEYAKRRMQELRNERGNICAMKSEYCEGQLEFAHTAPTTINGMGRGRKERIKNISANPECYILLCKKHHAEYDLLRYELPTSVRRDMYATPT